MVTLDWEAAMSRGFVVEPVGIPRTDWEDFADAADEDPDDPDAGDDYYSAAQKEGGGGRGSPKICVRDILL